MRVPRELTYEKVREIIRYDPETGSLYWLTSTRNFKPGLVSQSNLSNGYRQVQLLGKNYRAHRIAWLLMTGDWPDGQVDHANRDRSDNRWSNLRIATNVQNAANSLRGSGMGLPKGVRPQKSGRFQAKIWVNGCWLCLGTYDTPKEASAAYIAAAIKIHGEFARGA